MLPKGGVLNTQQYIKNFSSPHSPKLTQLGNAAVLAKIWTILMIILKK